MSSGKLKKLIFFVCFITSKLLKFSTVSLNNYTRNLKILYKNTSVQSVYKSILLSEVSTSFWYTCFFLCLFYCVYHTFLDQSFFYYTFLEYHIYFECLLYFSATRHFCSIHFCSSSYTSYYRTPPDCHTGVWGDRGGGYPVYVLLQFLEKCQMGVQEISFGSYRGFSKRDR